MTPTENRHYWRDHLQQWQNSDITQSAYCRAHELCRYKFSYYKKALLPDERPLVSIAPKTNGFIQVPIQIPFDDTVEPLTLHFANGVRLSGIAGNNLEVVNN